MACSSGPSSATSADAGADAIPDGDAGADTALDAGSDGTLPDGDLPGDASTNDGAADPPDASDDGSTDAGTDASTDGPVGTPLPVLLAPGVTSAVLAVDDTNVYFTTGDGGVSGIPKTGGPTFVVAQPSPVTTVGGAVLHLDGGILYWDPLSTYGTSNLLSSPAAARDAKPTLIGNFGLRAIDFAVSGGTAYAANSCLQINTLPVTPDAGAPGVLFDAGCNRIPQWLSFQLDVTSGTLDALDDYPYQIDRISLGAGARTSFVVDPDTAMMAVHGDTIYWVTIPACDADGGCPVSTLHASALDGSHPTVVASGAWQVGFGEGSFGSITDAYAFLLVDGAIVRVTLASGESHVVYSVPDEGVTSVLTPGSVAADDSALYVVDPVAGLLRIPD